MSNRKDLRKFQEEIGASLLSPGPESKFQDNLAEICKTLQSNPSFDEDSNFLREYLLTQIAEPPKKQSQSFTDLRQARAAQAFWEIVQLMPTETHGDIIQKQNSVDTISTLFQKAIDEHTQKADGTPDTPLVAYARKIRGTQPPENKI